MRSIHNLNYKDISLRIVDFIRDYVFSSRAGGIVIGLSGGIDSAVVASLCVEALGKENVYCLIIPTIHTPGEDTCDAMALANQLEVNYDVVTINHVLSKFAEILPQQSSSNNKKTADGNLTARVRMSILYYHAAIRNYLVAGTGDKSELSIGYFTKYGDGGADFLPIGDLYKTQVRELAKYLNIPENIINKKSSPRLWKNHIAEDELGIEYEVLDKILQDLENNLEIDNNTTSPALINKVRAMIANSEHKRNLPPICKIS